MKKVCLLSLICLAGIIAACSDGGKQIVNELRAPAYPLVTIDPYTSAWSMADRLYDTTVKHWTGKEFPFLGVIKVDGVSYRFMGEEEVEYGTLVGTADAEGWIGKYVFEQPRLGWEKPEFNDAQWNEGPAPFGKSKELGAKTIWDTEYIYVRRVIDLPADFNDKKVFLNYYHDDVATIYINGVKVVDTIDRTPGLGSAARRMNALRLKDEVMASLHEGKNVIAACCRTRRVFGLLDFGLSFEKPLNPIFTQTATQTAVNVQATQTFYSFACGPIDLQVIFTAPAFAENLDLVSRPVNYLTYKVKANDGKQHDVQVYFEAAKQWAVNHPLQLTVSSQGVENGLAYVRTGNKIQEVLGKKGDDFRIDWGYFYMAAPKDNVTTVTGESNPLRSAFKEGKELSSSPATTSDKVAIVADLGNAKSSQGHVLLAYDDGFSIQYFGNNLRPYWNRNNDQTIFMQLQKAESEYASLMKRAIRYDAKIYQDALKVGGKKFAELCATAYRQVMAAHKLVQSPQGELLWLSKENYSNGSINTVDLTYPSAPIFLVYNPELEKAQMNGIFYYSESGKWTKPFSAHDIGTYPIANGQTYRADMPVEESGNMLILAAAIAMVERHADYAAMHWEVLTTWTNYLVEKGLDPEDQLCTDDFAGHLAHNANLSIKAILGVASYARLAKMLGKNDVAEQYMKKAKEMASQWPGMAEDGDHYKLAFDKPGTWSQKYNLVWDKLLKFDLFPEEIAQKELKYYLTKQNKYGLPLDSRETYTKSDWVLWTASMADDRDTFEQLITPIWQFMNDTPKRVPMSDWSWTLEPQQRGFQARSVIGGYWMPQLKEKLK